MRRRIAEVDQQPIAQILRNVALKAVNHGGAGLLIGAHHFPELFRIELRGEGSRAHQITEHHGELAALGFRCSSLRPVPVWNEP